MEDTNSPTSSTEDLSNLATSSITLKKCSVVPLHCKYSQSNSQNNEIITIDEKLQQCDRDKYIDYTRTVKWFS